MPNALGSAALREAIESSLERFDGPAAIQAALAAVSEGLTVSALYAEVLTPLMLRVGERWQNGELAVWQEHYASGVVRTIVDALYPAVIRAVAAPIGKSALLACCRQETHDLGLRMLSDRFEMAGWTPFFLGADVPDEEIVAAAETLRPDLVVLSAATHLNRLELRDEVERIRPRLAGIEIKVTGYAFAQPHKGWSADEILDADVLLGAG